MVSIRKYAKGLAAGAVLGIAALSSSTSMAQTADPIKFGMCYDISKSYTFVSPGSRRTDQYEGRHWRSPD